MSNNQELEIICQFWKLDCSVHEVCALFKFSEVRAVCKQRDPARVVGNHPDTKSGMVFPSTISTPISACSLSMSSVYATIMSESCFFLNEFMWCLICVWFLQVRSRMASLDGLVPPTNGLTIGSSGMVNVFLSMEHQSILWCNQMAIQVCEIFFLLSLHL